MAQVGLRRATNLRRKSGSAMLSSTVRSPSWSQWRATKTLPRQASRRDLAVLAGIAAADAACCAALGRRARGQDHRQAVSLLTDVQPGGAEAARHLERLLNVKDAAHYGVINVTSAELRRALRSAERLADFAKEVLAR